MADDAWRNLRDLATANDWTSIVALIDQLDAGPVVRVITPDGTGPDALAEWCAAAAPAVTVTPAGEPAEERFLVALPVPVDGGEAPRLFARIRRWCADRPPGSCLVVLLPGPDAELDLARVRRTLDRLLPPSAHVTRPGDDDRLGEFLRAPQDPAVREARLVRLLGAIDRLPGPAAAPETGHLETGLLVGVDRIEQRVRRDLDAGRILPAETARELTRRLRTWAQDARDRVHEVSPGAELPPPPSPPVVTERRPVTDTYSGIAAATVGAVAGAVLSRTTGAGRPGVGSLGAAVGAAAGYAWQSHQQRQAHRAAEIADAKRLVQDTAAAVRAEVARFLADLKTPDTTGADVLRAAREQLLTEIRTTTDIDPRKATRA